MILNEAESGTNREELVQRLALMESMIAEGRRSTARCGWIFVLWGLVDIAGMVWQVTKPHSGWVWPITIGTGALIQAVVISSQRKRGICDRLTPKMRSISGVWTMMGVALTLYCFSGIVSHNAFQTSYIAAIFMVVGMAHAISAWILRWTAQGLVAAVWWLGGVSVFFVPTENYFVPLFIGEMFFGMVLFGLYAMWLESRGWTGGGERHA
jgi:hypothetical protein